MNASSRGKAAAGRSVAFWLAGAALLATVAVQSQATGAEKHPSGRDGSPNRLGEADSTDVQGNADPMDQLLSAIRLGDASRVKQWIRQGDDIRGANRYGLTPLAAACQFAGPAIVEQLLDAGARPDALLPGGETALMWASRRGSRLIIQALLDEGADPNHRSEAGQTALMWAAAAGNLAAAESLIRAGADLDVTLPSGFNAMMFAVRNGHADLARHFLDCGVDIHAVMVPERRRSRAVREGTSALMLAVENAHFDLAMMLVDAGADPNDQRSGFTPLHAISWVRKSGRGDGPDDDPPPSGSGKRDSLQFVRDLVEAGADVNRRRKRGRRDRGELNLRGATPLLMAASTADLALMKVLDELGGDLSMTNVDGTTPLLAAAGVGVRTVDEEPGTEPEVLATLRWLLDRDADPNVVDDNGESAMHGAAYRSFPQVAEWLSRHGATASTWDQPNDKGWTPIRIAQGYRYGAFKPNPKMVEVLVAAGGSLERAARAAKSERW